LIDFKVGNCRERLKEIPDSSIDCMVTDPPYGYSFMGKDWDKVVIGTDIWKECLRVLKPGGFAFVMSAPRQDVLSRMMINLEDSGFETGFTSIYWTYATGFPKGMNMSKSIDKKMGVEPTKVKLRDYTGPDFADKQFIKQGSMMQTHETSPRVEQWETKPTTEKAKEMEGSYAGYQPKPAVEVIIVCMKPLSEGNYVNQAMENGKGVTWLNDCRIPHNDPVKTTDRKERADDTTFSSESCGFDSEKQNMASANPEGRYPSNLLVSDDVFSDFQDKGTKPHPLTSKKETDERSKEKGWGSIVQPKETVGNYGDAGSFSRYFDLDRWWANFIVTPKASKAEKNRGLDGFEEKDNDRTNQNWKCKKCGKFQLQGKGDICKCENPDWERGKSKNNHPTVKPLKLMSYLITLGSRPNDTILDPFSGSGTTCLAANILDRNAIGIELNPEYAKIAKARLEGWK